MEPNLREERRKIFRQELFSLKEGGYLSDAIAETVAHSHHAYLLDLVNDEISRDSQPSETKMRVNKKVNPKPQKVKKTLSQEELRERNITWSLNIGVIFLLIGGLFVATSNWESMTSFMKSASIAIVSLLFYGMALLTKKVLHIEKTAFAFFVLGSLFLPIFILSLGWFGLLGTYLSIFGDGRYLLGMLGSLLPVIVYISFAKYLHSRLFVWFSYIAVTAGTEFFLASLNLKIDFFYLGLMVFNTFLIFVYHQMKSNEKLKLFTKEFVPFVQVNLVLCTLFMLFLYDNKLLYSFNLLLTAIIYLSMIYVSGKKEYHFVFSTMLIYGVYQLIEHSILNSFGAIVYALVGFGIVFVPKAITGNLSLDKVFKYTSAVISGSAFFYISLEGLLLRAGQPSVVLMIAYFIIAANFTYLSNYTLNRLFPYLGSVFTASGLYELVSSIVSPLDGLQISFSWFISGYILYIVFGIGCLSKHIRSIQTGSKDVGIAIMMLEILRAINLSFWREAGVMLLLLVTIALMVHKKEKRVIYKKVALWVFPVSLGLSFVAFGEAIISSNRFYQTEFSYACNFAAGSIAVLLSSLIWRKMKELDLERTSSYTAQALYSFSIFSSIIGPINQLWVMPIVLLFGICLYYYFYKRIGLKWIPYFISITTLFSYFSIVHSFSMVFPFNHSVNSLIFSTSAVLLIILAYGCRKKDPLLSKAFAWVGHGIYPFALAFTWFEYNTVSDLSFFLSIITYALSTRIVITEWKIKAFLYGCFTSVLFFVSTGLNYLVVQYFGHYEFPITSALILLFGLFANQTFKKRTSFYAVPFSIIGIGTMLFTYPFEFMSYGVTIVYAAVILFYLHKLKWDIIGIIPLFFAFLAMVQFSFFGNKSGFEKLLLSGGIGISMILIGQLVYKKLFNNGRSFKDFKLDGFTFIAFLYFLFMYYFDGTSILSHALPGIMIAASIWLQRKRVPSNYSVLFQLLSAAYLLQPYYSIISEFQVPHLWKGELLALPWVLLMIFIRLLLQERFSIITKPLEWGILIIVSLFLIHDGLTNSSVYEGIILGSLSLLSMLSGMYWQIKSYFFTGSGVLLLNLFLQTRPYWGHMPWWGYLLVAGFILIIVASSNEWHKQKTLKGESTFITVLKTKVVNKIKKWN